MALELVDYAILCRMAYDATNTIEQSLAEKVNAGIHIEGNEDTDTYLILNTLKTDNNTLIVSVRGTQTMDNWILNLKFSQTKPLENTLVEFHDGYYEECMSVYSYLLKYITDNPVDKIVFNGHSAGGCVCSMLAYLLVEDHKMNIENISVVTFGAPIFTNNHGAEWFCGMSYSRVQISGDPVPRLAVTKKPKCISNVMNLIEYKHVPKTLYFIDDGGKVLVNPEKRWYDFVLRFFSGKIRVDQHSIDAYVEKLG